MSDETTVCRHESFESSVDIGRITDGENGPVVNFVAEIRIRCAQCHVDFGFIGPPAGVSWDGPTVSIDGLELQAPIAPGAIWRQKARYQVPSQERQA